MRKVVICLVLFLGLVASSRAEKIRFATGFVGIRYDLIMGTTQNQGFWRKQNLDVEWVPFRSANMMWRGVVGGAVDMGIASPTELIAMVARGVKPAIMVAQLPLPIDFYVWVRPDSPIQQANDLRGAKVGVDRLVGTAYAYARYIVRRTGLNEREVKFVGAGELRSRLALLKAGKIDAIILGSTSILTAMGTVERFKSEVRPVVRVDDFLPQPWIDSQIFAALDMVKNKPEQVKGAIKAVFAAIDFIENNPQYAIQKIKERYGFDDAMAKLASQTLFAGKRGRIEVAALGNVVNFLQEQGVIKELPVALEELYAKGLAE